MSRRYDNEAERVGHLDFGPLWRSWLGRLTLLAIVFVGACVPWVLKQAFGL